MKREKRGGGGRRTGKDTGTNNRRDGTRQETGRMKRAKMWREIEIKKGGERDAGGLER